MLGRRAPKLPGPGKLIIDLVIALALRVFGQKTLVGLDSTGELIDSGIGHFPLRPLEFQIGQPVADGNLLAGIVHQRQKRLVAFHHCFDGDIIRGAAASLYTLNLTGFSRRKRGQSTLTDPWHFLVAGGHHRL